MSPCLEFAPCETIHVFEEALAHGVGIRDLLKEMKRYEAIPRHSELVNDGLRHSEFVTAECTKSLGTSTGSCCTTCVWLIFCTCYTHMYMVSIFTCPHVCCRYLYMHPQMYVAGTLPLSTKVMCRTPQAIRFRATCDEGYSTNPANHSRGSSILTNIIPSMCGVELCLQGQ